MKKTIVFAALLSVLFLTDSCQALHRGIPKADRHRREREVVLTDGETTVLRNVREADIVAAAEEQAPAVSEQAIADAATEQPATDAPVSVKPDLFSDDTVRSLIEEEPSEEYMIDEALESERSARNAYNFSFVPLSGLIFLPGLLIGLVGTLICLSNFNKFEFVTEKGLNDARRARNTLIATSLIVVGLYVLLFALIIFLL